MSAENMFHEEGCGKVFGRECDCLAPTATTYIGPGVKSLTIYNRAMTKKELEGITATTSQPAQQPCKTCGGSRVDPGGLPACRTCMPSEQQPKFADFCNGDAAIHPNGESQWHAEPAQQPQEALPPLAGEQIWLVEWTIGREKFHKAVIGERPSDDYLTGLGATCAALSRAPVPEAGLTDEQIDLLWLLNGGNLAANRYKDFARAILAAAKGGKQ